jgi:hypothetical protein
VAEYCQRLSFEPSAWGFVGNLKRWLMEVDRITLENHELAIAEKGESMLKNPVRKTAPRGFVRLETAVAE